MGLYRFFIAAKYGWSPFFEGRVGSLAGRDLTRSLSGLGVSAEVVEKETSFCRGGVLMTRKSMGNAGWGGFAFMDKHVSGGVGRKSRGGGWMGGWVEVECKTWVGAEEANRSKSREEREVAG
eukprot:753074-Hanusia_phi.AAC.2